MLPQRSPSPSPSSSRPPLPPGHFLSLPPTYAQGFPSSSGAQSTASHLSRGLAPNVASLASADFDVDVRTGFLPGTKNIERLPDEWDLWEDALAAARGCLVLGGGQETDKLWRDAVESMSVLDTTRLQASLPLLRRAHLVLSFILHFYVHTRPAPALVPEPISIPLVTISNLLGIPPILTYSDTVLYNFLPLDPKAPLSSSNPPTHCLERFTHTRSEEQFYIISALCEIAGAEALRFMRQSLDELFLADAVAIRRLTVYLRKLAAQIDVVGDITLSMIKEVDPWEFYHIIRPWFRGGDADGPSSPGWTFLGIAAGSSAESRQNNATGSLFSGPSAGQSSLIHAIDIFLTVDHTAADLDAPNEETFVQRMLQYMPLPHRTFLLHLADNPTPLRQLVFAQKDLHPRLAEAYDNALEALKRFREKHMRVVSLFIIQQARRQGERPVGEIRGTGGSPLFKFLKRCRDNTNKAMVQPAGSGYQLETL